MMLTAERRIADLEAMSSIALRDEWQQLVKMSPPRISPSMLRLALAWHHQAASQGGLSRHTQQKLAQLARGTSQTTEAKAGMRLVREWNGRSHIVNIGEDGIIRWNEREWRSLSEVARAITGTRWSGPAFFGLKKRVAA